MTTELIVFPDAVNVVVGYLEDRLVPPVRSRVPAERPDTFVRVQRIGGTRLNLVTDDAMLSIECWGASEQDAYDLAQLTRAWVHKMRGQIVGDTTVYRISEIAGPALLPDPASEQPRAVFTVLIAMRGDVVEHGS